jgi:hypothetical protein
VITEAAGLAIFLTLSSGWGRLVPSRWWANPRRSAVLRSYLLGFVLFVALFAIAIELHLPFPVATTGTVVFAAIGILGLIRAACGDLRSVLLHLLIGIGVAAYWVVGASIRGNEDAADPPFYAVSPFVLFRSDWLAQNVAGLPDTAPIMGTLQIVEITRASASAILWPVALVGDGLGVGQVTEAAAGLLIVAGLLCADLVPHAVNRWVAAATGIGGIGVYNALAVLSGGQLQQAVALLVVLACLWLARACINARAASFIFAIGGFEISASYPEFLVALPIYVAALAVIQHQPRGTTIAQLVGLIAGFGIEQALIGGASLSYLLNQSAVAPGWEPLPYPPGSVVEVLVDLVLQTRPPVAFLAFVGLATALFWARWRSDETPERVPRHALLLLALGCLAWMVALIRTPNLDYAVFKLGGWLGPGLLLLMWGLVHSLSNQKRRLAQAGIVLLALSRSASLVYGGNEVLSLGRPDLAQRWPRVPASAGGCVVTVDATEYPRAVAPNAGSAAPVQDCCLNVANPPRSNAAAHPGHPAALRWVNF